MNTTSVFALALAVSLAAVSLVVATGHALAATAQSYHHHPRVHHRVPAARNAVAGPVAQPSPTAARPPVSPPVQNDSDGLSRDPEDCMLGCIGTTE
jgi:hypothetical protein